MSKKESIIVPKIQFFVPITITRKRIATTIQLRPIFLCIYRRKYSEIVTKR